MPVAAIGLPQATPNAGYVVRRLRDPERAVREAVAYFDTRSLPGAILVRDGADAEAERACEALGLTRARAISNMARELTDNPPAPATRLDIVRCTTPREHERHVRTDAAGFDEACETARLVFPASLLDASGYQAFTGLVHGEPVATATLWVTGRIAGVFGVSVLPAYRRQGFGAAMTRRALDEGARLGCVAASLQPSPMALEMYEQIGFRSIAEYGLYVGRRSIGGGHEHAPSNLRAVRLHPPPAFPVASACAFRVRYRRVRPPGRAQFLGASLRYQQRRPSSTGCGCQLH